MIVGTLIQMSDPVSFVNMHDHWFVAFYLFFLERLVGHDNHFVTGVYQMSRGSVDLNLP